LVVANAAKLLQRMRANPRDWRIEDLKVVADSLSLPYRQQGTSHVVFRHPSAGLVTIPAARPIKSVYVRQFIALIDRGEGAE
jgi:hypothetical protein